MELAKEILALGKNNLNELGKVSLKELMTIKGIGEAKAITLSAALELGRRRQASSFLIKHLYDPVTNLPNFQLSCHNHPSGSLKPSRQDEELTHKIKEAAKYLDIQVVDHLIVSDEGYFSFADEGLL